MSSPQPISEPAAPPRPVSPVWHTVLFIVFVAAYSGFQFRHHGEILMAHFGGRLLMYLYMVSFELILLGYVWFFGLRRSGVKMADIIGGKWNRWQDVLRDIGIALAFWVVVAAVLVVMRLMLGANPVAVRALKILMPQSLPEVLSWIVLSGVAGVCEEIIFRGYLQRQFLAWTGKDAAAIVLQAIVFGSAHAYQGILGVVTIIVYGALFGILAVMCRSLRPGMIQHFLQDSTVGIVMSVVSKQM
ncbi:MAG: CPBP family intramembrane glutamic endopeptidase [Candidatus Acidiferrales bacterium]